MLFFANTPSVAVWHTPWCGVWVIRSSYVRVWHVRSVLNGFKLRYLQYSTLGGGSFLSANVQLLGNIEFRPCIQLALPGIEISRQQRFIVYSESKSIASHGVTWLGSTPVSGDLAPLVSLHFLTHLNTKGTFFLS